MSPRPFAFFLALLAIGAHAQMAGTPPQSSPATPPAVTRSPAAPATTTRPKRQPPHPLADEAPGGGPDKVWVNLPSGSYHCPGDRYYGRTAHGRYMTEAAAKSAGAHGPRGKNCPAVK